jgi:hypothetical protein
MEPGPGPSIPRGGRKRPSGGRVAARPGLRAPARRVPRADVAGRWRGRRPCGSASAGPPSGCIRHSPRLRAGNDEGAAGTHGSNRPGHGGQPGPLASTVRPRAPGLRAALAPRRRPRSRPPLGRHGAERICDSPRHAARAVAPTGSSGRRPGDPPSRCPPQLRHARAWSRCPSRRRVPAARPCLGRLHGGHLHARLRRGRADGGRSRWGNSGGMRRGRDLRPLLFALLRPVAGTGFEPVTSGL